MIETFGFSLRWVKLLILLFGVLYACDGGSSSGSVNLPRYIDIVDARTLIITGDTSSLNAKKIQRSNLHIPDGESLDSFSIYKIVDSGLITKVVIEDESGFEIDGRKLMPKTAERLSPKYVLISFIKKNKPKVRVLVDTRTGQAYDAKFLPDQIKWTDYSNANIYIAGWGRDDPLLMVRQGSDGSLEAISLPKGPDQIGTLAGDAAGNFVTYVGDRSHEHGSGTIRRFIALNFNPPVMSNIVVIPGEYYSDGRPKQVSHFNVKALDGQVYAFANESYHDSTAYVLGVDSQGNPTFTRTEISVEVRWLPEDIAATYGLQRIILDGSLFYTDFPVDGGGFPIEVDIPSNRVFRHGADVDLGLRSIRWHVVSRNYFWYLGSSYLTGIDVVVRYNPATQSVTVFDSHPGIEIKSMEVVAEDQVLITGYSASLQGDVQGYLNEDGTFYIDELFNHYKESIIMIYPLDLY